MSELEDRVNLLEQTVTHLMVIVSRTATPEQGEMLNDLDKVWIRELKEIGYLNSDD